MILTYGDALFVVPLFLFHCPPNSADVDLCSIPVNSNSINYVASTSQYTCLLDTRASLRVLDVTVLISSQISHPYQLIYFLLFTQVTKKHFLIYRSKPKC